MTFNVSSTLTTVSQPIALTGVGGTITATPDTAPQYNGKQYSLNASALTGLGGSAVPHSLSTPHTVNMTRPLNYRLLPSVNPVTGVLRNVPKNTFTIIHRKSLVPLTGQSPALGIIRTSIELPAGCETADLANLKAFMQADLSMRVDQRNGITDVLVTGSL